MKQQQARNDDKDNRRVMRWGIAAVILLVVLAVLGYRLLTESRERSSTMPEATSRQAPATAPQQAPAR